MAELSSNGPESARPGDHDPDYRIEDADLCNKAETLDKMLESSETRRLQLGPDAWSPSTQLERAIFKDLQRRIHSYVKAEIEEHRQENAYAPINLARCICSRPVIALGESVWNHELSRSTNPFKISCTVEIVADDGSWLLLTGNSIERFNNPVLQEVMTPTLGSSHPSADTLDLESANRDSLSFLTLYSPAAFFESWERLKQWSKGGSDDLCEPLIEAIQDAIAKINDKPGSGMDIEIVSLELSDTIGKAVSHTRSGSFQISCEIDSYYTLEALALSTLTDLELAEGYELWCKDEGGRLARSCENTVESEFTVKIQKQLLPKLLQELTDAIGTEQIKERRIEIHLTNPRIIVAQSQDSFAADLAFLAVITDRSGKYLLINSLGKIEEFNHPVGLGILPLSKLSQYEFGDLYSRLGYREALDRAASALGNGNIESSELALDLLDELITVSGQTAIKPRELKVFELSGTDTERWSLNTNLGRFTVSLAHDEAGTIEVEAILQKPEPTHSRVKSTDTKPATSDFRSSLSRAIRRIIGNFN